MIEKDRVIGHKRIDEQVDSGIRPLSLDDYHGQKAALTKSRLRLMLLENVVRLWIIRLFWAARPQKNNAGASLQTRWVRSIGNIRSNFR